MRPSSPTSWERIWIKSHRRNTIISRTTVDRCDKKYQSEGNVGDAFDGATTDAISFLNVVIKMFSEADESRIAIYGEAGAEPLLC